MNACPDETRVLPYFIVGLSNSFFGEIRRRILPRPGDEPIRIRYGTPISCGELKSAHDSDEFAITQQVMDVIQDLGQQDRREFAPPALEASSEG